MKDMCFAHRARMYKNTCAEMWFDMNIKRAKTEVINAVKAYLMKDEDGKPVIPQVRQRPIFLIGAPGIGKTAIMRQIAVECGIGLVSYTMTHHTRQSALGLPFIEEKEFEGFKYKTTQYTMSEIIASIYEYMKKTDVKQGILFIDEINCVSETLSPVMLQFLQEKAFGNARVPEGWIIVAAGNPQEYNKSVRDFDVATYDRVKLINVEADYSVWKEYAQNNNVHPAILSYLDSKQENFYKIQTTVDGRQFVTARGWQDMSDYLKACERLELTVDEEVVSEYVRCPDIAADFANYLELFYKYEKLYCMDDILDSKVADTISKRIKEASFDERISVVSLMISSLNQEFKKYAYIDALADNTFKVLKEFKNKLIEGDSTETPVLIFEEIKKTKEKEFINKLNAGLLDNTLEKQDNKTNELLNEWTVILKAEMITENEAAFERLKREFNKITDEREKCIAQVSAKLENGFDFIENAFAEGAEMLLFVTELAAGSLSLGFITENGCERFYKYNRDMLRDNKRNDIRSHIDEVLSGE